MIDRILIMGILVWAALLLLFWKADDEFMNKVRERMGISVTSSEWQVASTWIIRTEQNDKF